MYITISILFVVTCLLFLSLKYFDRINQKYERPISFLLTIVATFIGVFVAIAFSNYNERKIDLIKTMNLLEISGYELGQIKMECDMSQSILDADSTIDIDSFIHSNPISHPEIFSTLMNNDLFIRNVSLPTFKALSRYPTGQPMP
ncbi:MAG: hypothetical protein GF353_00580 [Candidatus Lokiarchaeota archaeon]|nr:hypothetical protein [Candidatus Lokiarchaeota archaeon]